MHSYDCAHPLETGMPVYPGDAPVAIVQTGTVPADGAALRRLECSSHVGTHVDAPAHMVADGETLDSFDVDAFRFDARLVDCTPAMARERLTQAVLPESLRAAPAETDADMLVFHTGWDAHWGTARYRDSPSVDPALATWCADHGFHLGIDAFSPDPVPSATPARESDDANRESEEEPADHPAHAALCGAGRLIVENLRGLDRLPDRFELHAYPLRISDGDGSPVRAVARVADESPQGAA
jgi:kynurenine formamidase